MQLDFDFIFKGRSGASAINNGLIPAVTDAHASSKASIKACAASCVYW